MNSLHIIGWITIILCGVAQVTLFVLQASALRRYGHKSFLLLCLGSGCFLIYTIICGAPYFITFSTTTLIGSFWAGLAFAAVGMIIGVWGTVSLFRQYGRLALALHENADRQAA